MSVEKDLRTYMLTRSAITDLTTGIYAVKLPQDPSLPALTYVRVSTVRHRSQSGDSSLTRARIQYTCWGTTYEDAVNIADALESEMKSFSGTAGTTLVYASIVANRLDDYEPDPLYYMIPIDLMIQYNG